MPVTVRSAQWVQNCRRRKNPQRSLGGIGAAATPSDSPAAPMILAPIVRTLDSTHILSRFGRQVTPVTTTFLAGNTRDRFGRTHGRWLL